LHEGSHLQSGHAFRASASEPKPPLGSESFPLNHQLDPLFAEFLIGICKKVVCNAGKTGQQSTGEMISAAASAGLKGART
jgi:hypothetical protein